ncbi:hypothetical protein K3495_g2223 [Podosphaera aphanis]|nr:hypothetical protein K3495_g2223 [Podosphaera aphanis]
MAEYSIKASKTIECAENSFETLAIDDNATDSSESVGFDEDLHGSMIFLVSIQNTKKQFCLSHLAQWADLSIDRKQY